jgi:hypothetical protein
MTCWWLITSRLARATKDSVYATEAARLANCLSPGNDIICWQRAASAVAVSATVGFRSPCRLFCHSAIAFAGRNTVSCYLAAPGLPRAVGAWMNMPTERTSAFRIFIRRLHGSLTPELYRRRRERPTATSPSKQLWWLGDCILSSMLPCSYGRAGLRPPRVPRAGLRPTGMGDGANPFAPAS